MTPAQLDLIPDGLLQPSRRRGAVDLIEWLSAHGWQMTLLELTTERERRGLIRTSDQPKERHHR